MEELKKSSEIKVLEEIRDFLKEKYPEKISWYQSIVKVYDPKPKEKKIKSNLKK
ncbi:MAG: hypothetical protein LBT04_02095 [Prevotellaceae bacterium]|jgi:predicted house-cleaning noncanonical NTP pyrophosphatase (MazG superfamily)|nr:hypothetical protein [Prevotellaceae bacterium]